MLLWFNQCIRSDHRECLERMLGRKLLEASTSNNNISCTRPLEACHRHHSRRLLLSLMDITINSHNNRERSRIRFEVVGRGVMPLDGPIIVGTKPTPSGGGFADQLVGAAFNAAAKTAFGGSAQGGQGRARVCRMVVAA